MNQEQESFELRNNPVTKAKYDKAYEVFFVRLTEELREYSREKDK